MLAELAAEVDAYCVVVGSRREGILATFGRMFRPSVSRSVLREQRAPVLVVPAAADDDDTDEARGRRYTGKPPNRSRPVLATAL